MDYNSIMIPLRLIAIAIAAGICIFFMCSFSHPFDLHYCTEIAIEDYIAEREREEVSRDRACYISFHNRKNEYSRESFNQWREEKDRELFGSGTCDFHDQREPSGTFNN